jgi:hypothetical protein
MMSSARTCMATSESSDVVWPDVTITEHKYYMNLYGSDERYLPCMNLLV